MKNRNSSLGLGCWGLGGDAYGLVDEAVAKSIIEKAQNSGIGLFDTAPSYGFGLSEERLGKYLPKNHNIIIVTKVGMSGHTGINVPMSFTNKSIENSINSSS